MSISRVCVGEGGEGDPVQDDDCSGGSEAANDVVDCNVFSCPGKKLKLIIVYDLFCLVLVSNIRLRQFNYSLQEVIVINV